MFGLVDCNNFYASCEQVFNPSLTGRPVIVLSNNDGCVVARSAAAKALGIKMGEPIFKLRDLIRRHKIAVFSSNYALYGDMSARVMRVLSEFTPNLEVYSIDEAFLDLQGSTETLYKQGLEVRKTVRQWLGLPVCIGIAPTKTLAKAANWGAKQGVPASRDGVLVLDTEERQAALLASMPLDEVWGVGRRLHQRLGTQGMKTALDLRNADPHLIRQQYGVVLARTVLELQGESCIPLEESPPPRQQIVVSRTFGERLTELTDIEGAIASFMLRAAAKLRGQSSSAKTVSVKIETNHFNPNEPQYGRQAMVSLVHHTQDSRVLVQTAINLLRRIYRKGYRYKRAGVMLLEIAPKAVQQHSLFGQDPEANQASDVMAAVDQINQRFGRHTLQVGRAIQKSKWEPVACHRSPLYTTSWSDLAEAR